MANILGRLTNNGVDFLHVDADPSAGPGTPASQGTVAAVSAGSLWQKTGGLDTDWTSVGSSSIPGNKLVFQPGGVSSGNLYGTWGEVVTALASINGSAEVEFDFSVSGSPVVIPPGAYSLGEVTFTLSPRVLTFPVVQFGTGTIVDGLLGVRGPMILESTGTTSPISYASGINVFILDQGARLISSGTSPFIDVQAGASLFPSIFVGGQLSNAGGSDVIALSATSSLQVNLFENGLIDDDVISGPAGAAAAYAIFSPAVDASTTQTNLIDPVVVSLQSRASLVGYSPTTPADWSPVPDDVGEALDQIASSLVPGNFLVFQPGGTPSGNVYDDWSLLYADLLTVSGPIFVAIDDSIVSPVTLPAGTYDLSNVTLLGIETSVIADRPSLVLPEGVIIQNVRGFQGLGVTGTATVTPNISYSAGTSDLFLGPFSTLNASGTVSPLSVGAGATLTMRVGMDSAIQSLGGFEPITMAAGSFISVVGLDVSNLQDDTVRGDGSLFLTWTGPSSSLSSSHLNFTGTITEFLDNVSRRISYDDSLVLPTLGVDNVQEAIDTLKSSSSGATNFLVFQPGGTPSGNVYDDWATLYAVLLTIDGPKFIQLDDAFSSPINIPVGLFDLSNTLIVGRDTPISSSRPTADLQEGTVLQNLIGFHGVNVNSLSTSAPNITYSSGTNYLSVGPNSSLTSSGTTFCIEVSAVASLTVHVAPSSSISNTGFEAISGVSGCTINILGFEGSSLSSDAIRGDGSLNITWSSPSASLSSVQTNFSGTITEFLDNLSRRVFYDDALTSPTLGSGHVQGAIDALKTRGSVTLLVNQVGHGFSPLDVIRLSGGTYVLAQANSSTTLGQFVVSTIVDVDNFILVQSGQATIPAHGLTIDEYYFLSDTVAGGLSITAPNLSNPMLYVQDANTVWVFPWRPLDATSNQSDPSYIRRIGGTLKGSTNTNVVRWSTAAEATGIDITYVANSVSGDSFLINTTGIYSVSCSGQRGPISLDPFQIGISPVIVNALGGADTRANLVFPAAGGGDGCLSWTGPISAGDRVYVRTPASMGGAVENQITITRIDV